MTPSPAESSSERRIISYFDHEFLPLSYERATDDVTEMIEKGFTNVVLCVTESDVVSKERQTYLRDVVDMMRTQNLDVWADPWGVGSVHGGEARSLFKERGELSCMCNPKLDGLLQSWLDTVNSLGIDTIFWDEPEMKCDDHRQDEVRYLEVYTAEAARRGLESVVCLCANDRKRRQLTEVAALDTVAEVATDPYFPNAFSGAITSDNRREYVRDWANFTVATAEAAGKRSHVWVQLFDIPKNAEGLANEHLADCRQALADVAFWGFRGCVSVPNFAKASQVAPLEAWHSLHLID